ncbi:hypothetical protein [Roseibium sp.]|uniref:hypothetical protein n=1 Tax=Roseibium sp. TaxID=1936156 RepID=UPI003D0FC900
MSDSPKTLATPAASQPPEPARGRGNGTDASAGIFTFYVCAAIFATLAAVTGLLL